jgi:predicted transcriptional regulator
LVRHLNKEGYIITAYIADKRKKRKMIKPYISLTLKRGNSMPSPEKFRENVEKTERKHGISDCIYRQSIEEFSRVKLSQLNEEDEIRIIRPFLLTWGAMVRVLGYGGVREIRKKLKDINEKIEPLRSKDLFSVKLDEIKKLVIELFDEIRKTKFESEKGDQKEVGSTAASKVLHLTCPKLFIMWDSAIRGEYKKNNGDGKDFFEFLSEMKNTGKELEDTINDLQQKYKNLTTRIIDQYNWMSTHNFKK